MVSAFHVGVLGWVLVLASWVGLGWVKKNGPTSIYDLTWPDLQQVDQFTPPCTRNALVGHVRQRHDVIGCRVSATFHYTDRTRPDKIRGLVGDPRGPNALCLRSGSPTKSGRVRLMEFRLYDNKPE